LPDPNHSLVSIVLSREANLGRASRTIKSAGVRWVTTVARFLCLVTGGPHPSGLRADYNLKLLNYSGLAPAD